jgi:hypothetical protein
VAEDLEAQLAQRARDDGVQFRIEQRPDGVWDASFWSVSGIPGGIGPEGTMLVGAEAQTREEAVAELAALLEE